MSRDEDEQPRDYPHERPVIVREIVRTEKESGVAGVRRIAEPLLVAAVVALIAAIWVLQRSVAMLQVSDAAQEKRLDRFDTRMDTLEGRTFRGPPDKTDANGRQP